MNVPFFSLQRQYLEIKDEIEDAISDVLSSGSYILGENVLKFECEFANYCGAKYAVGVASGSDALVLALNGLNANGSDVLTVSHTFISTADAIIKNNANLRFVDIDRSDFNMNVSLLPKAITDSTRGILPVHMYGHPVEMDAIKEIAEENGLWVVEDAAQAHGAEYDGKRVGSFGDASCFSFFPAKNLGAYGDAGIVVTNNKDLAEKIKMLRNYGQPVKYHHNIVGYNSRLDEIQATILRIKLKRLNQWIEQRHKFAKIYDDELGSHKEISIPVERMDTRHSYYLYVIKTSRRDDLREWLLKKGVDTGIHYPIPVHLQKSYGNLGFPVGSLPVTEQVANEVLSLPLYPEITEKEVLYVAKKLKMFYSGQS